MCLIDVEPVPLGTRHELGLENRWAGVTFRIAAVAVLFFGIYWCARCIQSHNPSSSLTQSVAWELLIASSVSATILASLYLLVKSVDITTKAKEMIYGRMLQARVRILERKRELPSCLVNSRSDDGKDLIDPISLEPFSLDQARCPRYLYVANAVIEFSTCLKALFEKELEHDSVGWTRLPHPLERYRLHVDDLVSLEEQIEGTLCLNVGHRDYRYSCIEKLYKCWNISASERLKDRIEEDRGCKFLRLFDESVHKFLPAF